MFNYQSDIKCYSYEINFDKPIEYILNLICDIGESFSLLEDSESYKILFAEDFIKIIDLHITDNLAVKESLLSSIYSYFNDNILSRIKDKIDKSSILLMSKPQKLIFGKDDKGKLTETLKKLFKREGVFNEIVENIRDERLKKSVASITNTSFNELFGNVVKLKDEIELPSPYFSSEHFDELTTEIIDENDIVINKTLLEEKYGANIFSDEVSFIINEDNSEIGIKYGNIIFPIKKSEYFFEKVKPSNLINYYFQLLKDVYQKSKSKSSIQKNPLLEDFKNRIRDSKLNKLLSFLEKNLYIVDESLIGEDYKVFFDSVQKIDHLKYVEDFDFFVSAQNGKTALGIYTNKKIGTEYNLIHWINKDKTGLRYYCNPNPENKKYENISSLKPEISFYFISKYFEDLVYSVIQELNLKDSCLRNFELYKDGENLGEIDFLLKTEKKLCIIEAKTKLTDLYIEEFMKKASKLIEAFDSINEQISIEFYLISAYSDDTCLNKKHFIDKSNKTKEGYNSNREGIKTIPYYFSVPFPKFSEYKLECIAEPEYIKLKEIINKVCQN